MSSRIRHFLFLISILCSATFGIEANLCRKISMLADLLPDLEDLKRQEPFPVTIVDKVEKMSDAETKFVGHLIFAIRVLARESSREVAEHKGDSFAYYSQFTRHRKPGQTIQEAAAGGSGGGTRISDTRMLVLFPGAEEIWSKLTPSGRLALTKSLASLYTKGMYEKRENFESPVHESGVGFSGLALLGAADRGLECGECRLAATAVASLLGELGAPAKDVRIAFNENHVWFEARMRSDGKWWVVDGTPDSYDGGAIVVPLSQAPKKYKENVDLHPLFLKPDIAESHYSLQLLRENGEINGLRYALGHQTEEAVELTGPHRPTLKQLILTVPVDGEVSANFEKPGVSQILAARYKQVRLDPESLGIHGDVKEWSVQDTQTIVAKLAQSPMRTTLENLSLGDLPANRELYDKIGSDFPRLDSLTTSADAAALVQSKLFSQLKDVEYAFPNEVELGTIMGALETRKDLQLKHIYFGRLYGLSDATKERVNRFVERNPQIKVEVEFKAPLSLRPRSF